MQLTLSQYNQWVDEWLGNSEKKAGIQVDIKGVTFIE